MNKKRFNLLVLAAVVVWVSDVQAIKVTHDILGVIFYDDLEFGSDPNGRTLAEVGTWAGINDSNVPALITGPAPPSWASAGPTASFAGANYIERRRTSNRPTDELEARFDLSDCNSTYCNNAGLASAALEAGVLTVEFVYWMKDDDGNSVLIADDNLGLGHPASQNDSFAYIGYMGSEDTNYFWDRVGMDPNDLNGGNSGTSTYASLGLDEWSQFRVVMDFDNSTTQVFVNGVGGAAYTAWTGRVNRIFGRNEGGPSPRRYFVDFLTCDFDSSGDCGLDDINEMFKQGDLVTGVSADSNNKKIYDLNADNSIDDTDITNWLALAGRANGYGDPNASYLRGDTDDLDTASGRTVDITDFQNFMSGFTGGGSTWEVGNFNGDGVVDITDFSLHFFSNFTASEGGTYGPGQSVPEPSTMVLLEIGGLLLGYISNTCNKRG